ncbi:hypothetical protein LXM50_16910 [Microbacterium sp. Au-Mic1]|uniref:hypothetical protein n=1 Tax=Microbacterium sp. Au-Mic1 TaxID=2906457 RepID=UPI001E5D0640|nr:hypothetical protein [Microbacterium sp. Au-Mic1]MCE4027659.1 hypothetical protein [Microbacterium sp. Au-Mic1]
MARIAAVTPGGPPRVDLLPRSEVERRERDALSRTWVRVGLLAILLAVALIAGAFAVNLFAQQRLAAEQDRSNQLIGQIAGLSDVSNALKTEADLTQFRADAMGSDLSWAGIFDRIRSSLPPDTNLTGFELTPGSAPVAGADAKTTEKAAKSAVGLTGTLTLDSGTALDLGAYVRSLRTVQGVLTADANSTTSGSTAAGRFTYKVDVTFDQTVYSGDYAKEVTK